MNKKKDWFNSNTTAQIENNIFLIVKPNLISKVIDAQNQLPISSGTALVCNKISIIRNSPPHTQEFLKVIHECSFYFDTFKILFVLF